MKKQVRRRSVRRCDVFNVRELAEHLNVHTSKIYYWVNKGLLLSINAGTVERPQWYIIKLAVEGWYPPGRGRRGNIIEARQRKLAAECRNTLWRVIWD